MLNILLLIAGSLLCLAAVITSIVVQNNSVAAGLLVPGVICLLAGILIPKPGAKA